MILPFLNGLQTFSKAPVTWVIFLLQVGVYIWSVFLNEPSSKSDELLESHFFKTQGALYAQYLETNKHRPSQLVSALGERIAKGASLKSEMLGHLALRDSEFVERAPAMQFKGDQVALHQWRQSLQTWRIQYQKMSSSLLGVNSTDRKPSLSWVTYLFAHGDFTHFLGNMIFLLLLGTALEPLLGGLGLLVGFLGFGIVSALVFLAFSASSGVPLVGASGAVSGMMMLICVLYRGRWPIRFVYWLILPFRGFTGFIYLPAVFLALFWLVADLAGHLSTPADLGGVAHLAHFGGALAGLVVGLVLLALNPHRGQALKQEENCFELIPLI